MQVAFLPGIQAQPVRRALLVGCGLLLLAAAVIPFDGLVSGAISAALPDGHVVRETCTRLQEIVAPEYVVIAGLPLVLSRNWWRYLLGFAVPWAILAAPLHGLKFAIGRARPQLDRGAYAFEPFAGFQQGMDSFPSGHVAQAVLLALLLSTFYPWTRWLAWPLAAAVAIARVAQERHFVSDVSAGAALALGCYAVSRLWLGVGCYPLPRVSLQSASNSK